MKIYNKLFGTLLEAPRIIWEYHLKTKKYSSHMALGDCYEELPELVDSLIEGWMGMDEQNELGDLVNVLNYDDLSPQDYIKQLIEYIDSEDFEDLFSDENGDLVSIKDDIIELLKSTLYKLTHLKESYISEKKKNIINRLPDNIKNNEVKYSDIKYIKKNPSNIFENIIIFTNDNREEKNKTLANVLDAIDVLKKHKCEIIPKVFVFESDSLVFHEDSDKIYLEDEENKLIIDEQFSNLNTLVLSRLGVQGRNNCELAVKLLQDRGFIILNPVRFSALACNKYETAKLLEAADIPQPKFALINKDILYDTDLYSKAVTNIYPEWDLKDPSKNKDLDVVVKILDGHGGTGVSLISGDKLYSVLQLIFAISRNIDLLIQKKEEADGGDIRVHVLTLRGKQIILGAMKRVKIKGDFRSNVSLGATAEKIKLTKEQEEIALKTARVSKLAWCAVDIMPLVKNSNPDVGDNVVLEINASPGTDGISEVLGINFINILLAELNDPSSFCLEDKISGYIESVSIKFNNNISKKYLGKLDTGNSTIASCLEVGDFKIEDDKVTFEIDGKKLSYDLQKEKSIAIVGDNYIERPVIIIPELSIGHRKIKNVKISLVHNRNTKNTNILINRDVMSKLGYTIHPALTHILTPEMEKVKIIK